MSALARRSVIDGVEEDAVDDGEVDIEIFDIELDDDAKA